MHRTCQILKDRTSKQRKKQKILRIAWKMRKILPKMKVKWVKFQKQATPNLQIILKKMVKATGFKIFRKINWLKIVYKIRMIKIKRMVMGKIKTKTILKQLKKATKEKMRKIQEQTQIKISVRSQMILKFQPMMRMGKCLNIPLLFYLPSVISTMKTTHPN